MVCWTSKRELYVQTAELESVGLSRAICGRPSMHERNKDFRGGQHLPRDNHGAIEPSDGVLDLRVMGMVDPHD